MSVKNRMLTSSFHILEKALEQHRTIRHNLVRDEPRTVNLSLIHARRCLERVTEMLEEAQHMRNSVAHLSRDFGGLEKRLRPLQRDTLRVVMDVRGIRHEQDVDDFTDDIMHVLDTFGDNIVRDVYCVGLHGSGQPKRKPITLEMRREAAKIDLRDAGIYAETTSLQNKPRMLVS